MPPQQIMELAETADEPYARLLRLLRCLREAKETNVKAFREQHQGATYRQLAQAAELTNETVNRIERADEPPTVYPLTARKLADALGVGGADIVAD
jgi:DNA-binding XRE family transcriptional regulator